MWVATKDAARQIDLTFQSSLEVKRHDSKSDDPKHFLSILQLP
jgi:hypothetical protein